MLGLRHWVVTVPEDEDGEAGCRGTTLAAAGEGGEEGRLPWPWPWPWPWELVRWKRHLKDPRVGGRRADALGSGPVARAGRRRRRPGPPPPRILGAVAGRFT